MAQQVRHRFAPCNGCADFKLAIGNANPPQAVDFAHQHELVEGAQLLGRPQTDIGEAGNDARIRVRRQAARQRRLAFGRKPLARRTVEHQFIAFPGQLAQGLVLRLVARRLLSAARHREGLLRRIGDRPVTGAATQISREQAVDVLARYLARRLLAEVCIEGHHEAWCAKPALRSMAIDHGLLHRMRLAFNRHTFYCGHSLAMQGRHELDARIHGTMANPTIGPNVGNGDRTRTAITLGAPFLGAG